MAAVAITGLGLVCALGSTVREAWPRLVGGDHGFAPISRFDASAYSARVAAEVTVPLPAVEQTGPIDGGLRRGTKLFMMAAAEAWRDAGLDGEPAALAAGVAAGASVNYLHMGQLGALWACRDGARDRVDLRLAAARGVAPRGSFLRRHGDTMAAAAASVVGLRGPRLTVDTACASGAHAIAEASRMVAGGEAPVMIAGAGSGLIVPVTLLAFSRIGALSANPDPASASRPFDRRRDGFVLGEGAAAVVLEPPEQARLRGARVHAEIAGSASTIHADSLTDPSPGGCMEAATMILAMRDAGIDPGEVDFVAAHGTSTPKNDATETQAIKRALGPHAGSVCVSSHKGQLGHTLPAAGAINVVLTAMALASQVVPPTAHLEHPDPDCDLDYVPHVGRPARLRAALANAFAFGGQNVSLVLRCQGPPPAC
jgi:3-oxoacyl-[acyl-carrier-protein] synthase II